MKSCPSCCEEITGKNLREQFSAKPYRVCPHCRERFTVDSATKRRQLIALLMATISLGLTAALFVDDDCLLPAIVSYAVLAIWIVRGERRARFVEYHGS